MLLHLNLSGLGSCIIQFVHDPVRGLCNALPVGFLTEFSGARPHWRLQPAIYGSVQSSSTDIQSTDEQSRILLMVVLMV